MELKIALYGEDFALFGQKKPSAFFHFGAAVENSIKDKKILVHHQPNFTFNEECLQIGVSVWIKLVKIRILMTVKTKKIII